MFLFMKERVQTLLEKKDIKKLSEIAAKEGHTLSSLIRHIVSLFLNSLK